jgi:proline racemase
MRSSKLFHAVDSHTEGMPTRVITGGIGTIPGATMAQRRLYFMSHLDDIRTLLMFEPRGHAAMSGAILQPPTRPDADWGVIFIEVSGCLPMCGHGTIGVATVLVETGMVPVTEPITEIALDTPAGLVRARVAVVDGRAASVTLHNVASFAYELDVVVPVAGVGEVSVDVAYGGNFYAIAELAALGIDFAPTEARARQRMLDVGAEIMDAVTAKIAPVHPENPDIAGCHHVYLAAAGSEASLSRHAMVIHPGWFDRSPCGTGTSARMAQLHARGQLGLNADFVNESIIGSRFTGRLLAETTVGRYSAVLPSITGRAWITGTAQYLLDPDDPFPRGFLL